MGILVTGKASSLGEGNLYPNGSLGDLKLSKLILLYKKTVASRYRGISNDEINKSIAPGKYHVSPKIDGQIWFLISCDGQVIFANPRGKIISGKIPFVVEATATIGSRSRGCTVVAGELFALGKRPRVGDITSMLGENGDVRRICFSAFDLLQGGDNQSPECSEDYGERYSVLERLLDGGKRVKPIKTEVCTTAAEVSKLFSEWAEGEKANAEGVIARNTQGHIFKIKPQFNIDLAVVGYTQRSESPDQVRSLLLALMREDGSFQLVGSCGNLGTDDNRRALHKQLEDSIKPSNFRYASGSGAVYKFVDPQVVVEIKCTDIQSDDSTGDPLLRMTLAYSDGWKAIQKLPGATMLHPVLERIRDDKAVNATDVRISQLQLRCFVGSLDKTAKIITLPESEVLRREVYTKVTKGLTAVRKIVVWKTNKDTHDPNYPPYVVHFTDYSPNRKKPLGRDVEVAPTEAHAFSVFEAIVKDKIKRGWNPA